MLQADRIDDGVREDEDLQSEHLAKERIIHLKGEKCKLAEVLRVFLHDPLRAL